jgi:hypothetical protein
MRVLLDNLGHSIKIWTEGNRNVLHRFEEIIDRVKDTLEIP